jgi:hypothetical protein
MSDGTGDSHYTPPDQKPLVPLDDLYKDPLPALIERVAALETQIKILDTDSNILDDLQKVDSRVEKITTCLTRTNNRLDKHMNELALQDDSTKNLIELVMAVQSDVVSIVEYLRTIKDAIERMSQGKKPHPINPLNLGTGHTTEPTT